MAKTSSFFSVATVFVSIASAQTFNGIWEMINPMPGSVVPTGNYFGHPITTGGCFIVSSSDQSAANSTFQYDPTPQTWSEYSLPPGGGNLQPLLISYGGYVLSFGSSLTDDLSVINMYDSASGPTGAWISISLPPAPGFGFRNGPRVVLFGSTLYRFGGCDMNGCHNDLWAIDISSAISTGFVNGGVSNSGWTLIFGDQTGANYPQARKDFIFETEGHMMIIFGGWSGTDASLTNDVWLFAPGNLQGPPGPNAYANSFISWATVPGVSNGGVPTQRMGSAHGIYGDNLMLFGGYGLSAGSTTGSTLNDLWVLNLPTQSWFQITPVPGQQWPTPAPGTRGAGMMIGRWMYLMVATAPNTPGANQLWRFTFPTYRSGGGNNNGGSSNNAANNAVIVGHTAGIAIAVLLGVANLALLLRSGGVSLPSLSGFSAPSLPSVSGFYSGAKAPESGGYVAPLN